MTVSGKTVALNTKKKWFTTIFFLLLSLAVFIEPSFAQGLGKVQSALDKIVDAMTGGIAKSIAIIAVAGTGIAWIAGYIELRKAFFVCVGIAIIFGAPQIVNMLITT
ncbi:type IV secretion protein VblB2 [Bartonella australis AUST/NH1]|uniref:Type IV secretion protein VblB2 n=1 Tax=Bartonella australis (strain Aust/NH1) TaxID=1094489 RepID=M1N4V5_BARAA|nr:TrbC/VirB2 family protein [Bartonella australis]AGF74924.1 type IV secretion protein VblB2 [Bartonella australis AUST/NH1]